MRAASITFREYEEKVQDTDRLPRLDLNPVLFGLYGEVGSIMTTAKKFYREKDVFIGYQSTIEEEFGDVLWYFAALCRRLSIAIDDLFGSAVGNGHYVQSVAATDLIRGPVARVAVASINPDLESTLLELGQITASLLSVSADTPDLQARLLAFAGAYIRAICAAEVSFAEVIRRNIAKARGRFLEPVRANLPTFDHLFPADERLPSDFAISVVQRTNGQSYLRWNEVFIGDPLTDNIADPDGYRFHDVFHFAHAAILNWSPVFRALVKRKRRSDPQVDETQDGGRAIVVEEGLTAWIFSRAKNLDFFSERESLPFDLLKTVQQFVAGYEVDQCPLKLWETAILKGYAVFRQVRDAGGGTVIGDRNARTIRFRPLEE
jgi:hypothetical protein